MEPLSSELRNDQVPENGVRPKRDRNSSDDDADGDQAHHTGHSAAALMEGQGGADAIDKVTRGFEALPKIAETGADPLFTVVRHCFLLRGSSAWPRGLSIDGT